MKTISLRIILSLLLIAITAQGIEAHNKSKKVSKKKAAAWVAEGEWKNGFDAMPDATVNLQEFYAQYHKNKAQWDAAFKWLAETDLLNIPKGKLMIPGTNIRASIEAGKAQVGIPPQENRLHVCSEGLGGLYASRPQHLYSQLRI